MLYGISANQMHFYNESVFANYSAQLQTPAPERPLSTR
jgi:hypothetical protein